MKSSAILLPVVLILMSCSPLTAQLIPPTRLVRIAELEIDPSFLVEYRAALKDEIESSLRLEPGVLALQAVSIKGRPAHVRIFEIYADDSAYRSHLETPHFKRYKAITQPMVKSLTLIETDPIALGIKAH